MEELSSEYLGLILNMDSGPAINLRVSGITFHVSGLWQACFNGFHDKGHQYEVKFYGCKHVLLEEYDIIRLELVKRE